MHYLLSQLHSTLKATLAAPSRFAGRPSAGGGGAHDTSGASELRALSGAALLRRIEPAVYSFREHAQTLLELLPQHSPRHTNMFMNMVLGTIEQDAGDDGLREDVVLITVKRETQE